ncbi:hypothetical protein QN277_005848 [Acacia crassicarpa]|uniref:F-box domain-containing protein n=1 Tax=Acacia crassicarpa TaxID=499986 RepID=A0AAE1MBM5_9FABA|nr:hypothetical protein QN277_005848 [Acacia crassicarpa]
MEDNEFFLPHEIISSILKRLPVKSLLRFRCVCKDWNDLFKTSLFIKEHLHHSSHHRGPSLLLQCGYSTFSMLDSDKKTLLPPSAPSVNQPVYIIGSSYGLVCLQHSFQLRVSGSLFLWNPSTREVQCVPQIKNNHFCRIAFGFSRVVNDYKIVKIFDYKPAEVYSLSTGSWKKVEFINRKLLKGVGFLGSFAATDQAIYWLSYHNQIDILSFDLATEVFTFIPRPDVQYIHRHIRLIAYENKLALLSGIEFWVMEEATSGGSGQRWSKTKVFGGPCLRSLHPLNIWRNEVVFDFEHQPKVGINLFNLTSNKLKEFLIAGNYGIRSAFHYVETLASIGDRN